MGHVIDFVVPFVMTVFFFSVALIEVGLLFHWSYANKWMTISIFTNVPFWLGSGVWAMLAIIAFGIWICQLKTPESKAFDFVLGVFCLLCAGLSTLGIYYFSFQRIALTLNAIIWVFLTGIMITIYLQDWKKNTELEKKLKTFIKRNN